MEEFLPKVAEILEVESVTPEFKFREIEEWDSLKGFSIIVLMEQDYGKEMSVEAFLECETVGDLAKFAGVA
jgi:acyl carrier protein